MKKIGSFVVVVMVLTATMWFNIGTAGATSAPPPGNPAPHVSLYSPYFAGLRVGKQVQAQMYVDSNFQNVHCVVTDDSGRVTCQTSRKYAGQSVILHINAGGKYLIFYITLPEQQPSTPVPVS